MSLLVASRTEILEESGILPLAAGILVLAIVISLISMPVIYVCYRSAEPTRNGRLPHPFNFVEIFYSFTALVSIVTGLSAFAYWSLYLLGWREGGRDQLPFVDFDYVFGATLIALGALIFILAGAMFPRKNTFPKGN